MKINKISSSLNIKLNNQYDFALLCLLIISIYAICFVILIGKAPFYYAFYEAKNWIDSLF